MIINRVYGVGNNYQQGFPETPWRRKTNYLQILKLFEGRRKLSTRLTKVSFRVRKNIPRIFQRLFLGETKINSWVCQRPFEW